MLYKNIDELRQDIKDVIDIKINKIRVINSSTFTRKVLDKIIFNNVFNESKEVRSYGRWLIKECAYAMDIIPSSIQLLYEEMGKGKIGGFTVPAVNIRGMSYDVARSLIRAAIKDKVGAFILEIAKSEIGYTEQRPSEYTTVMLGAAIKEGFKGPIFIQGDHFQINAKKYSADPSKEVEGLKALIREAILAGFYNIDTDTSTLVDLSQKSIDEQQRKNYELAASLTAYIRSLQPQGIDISVGGEIGEVGGKNSTVEELVSFMDNYKKELQKKGKGLKGISKISVQTGTTHGGVPLPDGTIADVKLDFNTLERLSKTAKGKYGLAGAVQHGASTLPDAAFDKFPQTNTAEIHLATGFQNMIYENSVFPKELKDKIYDYLRKSYLSERKPDQTDEQFIYKTRKNAFGPFKMDMWTISDDKRNIIGNELEEKFRFLFKKLNVINTADIVNDIVKKVRVPVSYESEIEIA